MTLNNSYSQTKRKIFTFWQETEKNTNKINVQVNRQNLINNQLNKSSQNTSSSVFELFNLDFVGLNVSRSNEDGVPTEAYQNWEVRIGGLKYRELQCIQHNYIYKFGNGEPLLSFNIQGDTTYHTNDYVEVSTKSDTRANVYILHYGVYFSDIDGLEEISDNGLMVKLNLSFVNPNLFG